MYINIIHVHVYIIMYIYNNVIYIYKCSCKYTCKYSYIYIYTCKPQLNVMQEKFHDLSLLTQAAAAAAEKNQAH